MTETLETAIRAHVAEMHWVVLCGYLKETGWDLAEDIGLDLSRLWVSPHNGANYTKAEAGVIQMMFDCGISE